MDDKFINEISACDVLIKDCVFDTGLFAQANVLGRKQRVKAYWSSSVKHDVLLIYMISVLLALRDCAARCCPPGDLLSFTFTDQEHKLRQAIHRKAGATGLCN